ncbi:MAG: DUF3048 domain-containing protein [Actinomycetota bacterium]
MVRRWRRGPALLLFAALVATGCGSDVRGLPVTERRLVAAEGVGVVTPGAVEQPTPTAAPIVGEEPAIEPADSSQAMPLTGLASTDRAGAAAIAVRIDNTRDAMPQRGLLDADVVIENLVEGRLTRLLAIYHSTLPDSVGPVRSARTTDVDLLPAFGSPGFAYWSSNEGVANEIAGVAFAQGLVDLGIDRFPDAYAREDFPDRALELTGFVSLSPLDEQLVTVAPPPVLFDRRPDDASRTQPLVPGVRIDWGALQDVTWVWADRAWVRSQFGRPHVDESGEIIASENVVVIETDYGVSAADPESPEAVSVGTGDALVLTDGALIEATWERSSPRDSWTFTDSSGQPVLLSPGVTWIEIVLPNMAQLLDPGRVPEILADAAPFLPSG